MKNKSFFIRYILLTTVLLMIGLLSICVPVFAQTDYAITYQQEQLMLIDNEGDRILLQLFLDTCETGLQKCQKRENVPPQTSQLRGPRFAQENPILPSAMPREIDNSRANPLFESQEVLNNFKKIIKAEVKKGNSVSIGQKHTWGERSFVLSKIILALATASSARFMYVGQEVPLIHWIASRPDNSITVEELFQQSYTLNKGNVYLTLLTIENVLSDATFEKNRENTLVNQKLTDLYAGSPNKFGDWYHFFGTMLAGYVEEPAQIIAQLYGIYRKISRGEDAEKATMAADKEGAKIGTGLRFFVEKEVNGIWSTLAKQIRVSIKQQTK